MSVSIARLMLGLCVALLGGCTHVPRLDEQRAADGGFGPPAVDACVVTPPAAPGVLQPSHMPITTSLPDIVRGPPPRLGAGAPTTGLCKGGCGADCNMNGRVPATGYNYVGRCTQWTGCDGRPHHRIDAYRWVRGNTHPFCTWHDACYTRCQQTFGVAGNNPTTDAFQCLRACDSMCLPPTGTAVCSPAIGITGSALQSRYGDILFPPTPPGWPTTPPGNPAFPPRTWGVTDCGRWPLNGGNGASTGTKTFSELISSSAVMDGACAPTHRIIVDLDRRSPSEQGTGVEGGLDDATLDALSETMLDEHAPPPEEHVECEARSEGECDDTSCVYTPEGGCESALAVECAEAE